MAMTFLSDLAGMLAMRVESLRLQAERRTVIYGILCFSAGFLAYVLLRNYVYAALPEIMAPTTGLFQYVVRLNLIQTLVFILWMYVPALILLGNAISGESLGLSVSGREYRMHLSALLPLWGLIFLIASPVQWIVPHFIIVGMFEVSIGFLIRSLLLLFYTVWAIKHLNYMTTVQAAGVFILSLFTLPLFYLLTILLTINFLTPPLIYFMVFYVLILLMLILVLSVSHGGRWFYDYRRRRMDKAAIQRHLIELAANPESVDTHYQLGLVYLRRGDPDAAYRHFDSARQIDPENSDCIYCLGRTCEIKEEWRRALEFYEETYRIDPEYGAGDICREIGKSYLHCDDVEKGMKFLSLFLKERYTDTEGRYWLAVALQKCGNTSQMIGELNLIMGQFRAGSRLFRKANRQWACRARDLLRQSRASELL